MKNILLLVDVQNGFAQSAETKVVLGKIEELLKGNFFDVIIATQFKNFDDSIYEILLNWKELKTIEQQSLCDEIAPYVNLIVEKDIYTCVDSDDSFISKLIECNDGELPAQIFIAGFDTDCCVLKIATDLFEKNVRPIVLTNYCASNGGIKSHEAGILCMRRLIGSRQLRDDEISSKSQLEVI